MWPFSKFSAQTGPKKGDDFDISAHTPLSSVMSTDISQDCLSCRMLGAGAFVGLGAYTFFSGESQLKKQREIIRKSGSRFGFASRQLGIRGMAVTLVGLGLYRLVY